MKEKQPKNNSLVRRITVDEKLFNDLIRLLISPLVNGISEFYDREEDWGQEQEVMVTPETYVQEMGIPLSERKRYLWTDLQEGQVFLSGKFKVVGKEESPEKFMVSPQQEKFLRIDKIIRKEVKRLYFEVLKRRIRHG